MSGNVTVEGFEPASPADEVKAYDHFVTGDYFRAMGIPLVRGERFGVSEHVAVVNETFAERMWPNEEAIGKRLVRGRSVKTSHGSPSSASSATWNRSFTLPRPIACLSSISRWPRVASGAVVSWSEPQWIPRASWARCRRRYATSIPASRCSRWRPWKSSCRGTGRACARSRT